MKRKEDDVRKWIVSLSSMFLIFFYQLYMFKKMPQVLPMMMAIVASAICIGINKYIILKQEKHNVHIGFARVALILGIASLMLALFFLCIDLWALSAPWTYQVG